MKMVIVDDEASSHLTLNNILSQHHPEIEVVGSGFNVKEGLALIKEHRPDILLLDIQMPDGTGFDLLNTVQETNFHLIFITGFDQYAQTAISFGALDYLLKPVSTPELTAAILKARLREVERLQMEQLAILREAMDKLKKKELPLRMSISTSDGVLYFPTANIIRLEAMQNFTEFKLERDSRRLIASHNLKTYEVTLKPYPTFMRIHRSYLINILKVVRLIKGEKSYVEMVDGTIIPVAKRHRDELDRRMDRL